MARLPRLVVPQQPHHLIQRGNDKQDVFIDDEDRINFLRWLGQAAREHGMAIHAYVLMSNHIHLLVTPANTDSLAKAMQWLGRHYVPYFNQKYQRSGTLWQGRYRTSVIDSEPYFLICSRYIELNPVRAGLLTDPEGYPWSSYRHHIGLKTDPLIIDHGLYWALGNTPFEREAAYRQLAEQGLTDDELTVLKESTLKGWATGTSQFKQQLERQLNRRVQPLKRGRPFKSTKKNTQ